jgi:trk system potassium uptake protein TrkH
MIRWPFILHILGSLIICIGLCMIIPIGFSLYYRDGSGLPLLYSAVITIGVGLLLYLAFRSSRAKGAISNREGMAITTVGWVTVCIFGGLPFYFSGVLPHLVDCIFETTSGFTTTGASVIRNVEIVAPGILFWRSLTHWLGGLGIVVLGLAILPFLGVGGMQLYKAEVPGPVVDKLKPRLKDTAMILWKVYVIFTIAETIMLLLGGMTLLDALCHTFGTLATGGFSTKNASIGYYHSVYIDTVVTIFMLIGGINFSLHFQLFRGKPLAMWRDPEFRFFMGFWLLLTLIIAIDCFGKTYGSFWKALQYASFTVASITTTTGFATGNFELWPPLSLCLLLLCMVVGASVGSTGGAVKCMRIMVVLKHGYRELIRLIHPRAVVRLKLADQAVPPEVFDGIAGFIFLYLGLAAISMFLVAAAGVDLVTTFSAVLACIGNVGPGLGEVGPMDNYAGLPTFAKWVLTLDMLLGRLEIYTVIILFVPRFYKK